MTHIWKDTHLFKKNITSWWTQSILTKLQRITQEKHEDTYFERNLIELQLTPIYPKT